MKNKGQHPLYPEGRWPFVLYVGANDGVAVPPDRDSRRGFNSL
jgi:hypothetical protein